MIPPRFPTNGLPSPALKCPTIDQTSSKWSHRFWFYVHEYVLLPFSEWYTQFYKIPTESAAHPLPFGLIMKRHERVSEQEGIAMNLARRMGIPAPRFISFGSLDSKEHFPSIVMTRLNGTPLDCVDAEGIDYTILKEDLVEILTRMRSFASPFGKSVCGVAGGPIGGPLVPASPMPPCVNESAFKNSIRFIGRYSSRIGRQAEYVVKSEELFALPDHAIVFTHGDLNHHNIMVGEDGHISGIFDWEAAGWLPEYWEISITAIVPVRKWGQFLHKDVTGGVYEKEIEGHRAMYPLIADSLPY